MFEARLGEIVRHFGDRVEITTRTASEIARLGVFVSQTMPNVLVVRNGELVAHAIGDLPLHELSALLTRPTGAR